MVGESVKQGQVIGTIGKGDGGYSAHLHYQVQSGTNPNGQSVSASFVDIGLPTSPNVYTSLNSNIINLEFNANGGYAKFGTLQNGVGQDIRTGIHWYHAYDPGSLYRGGQVPNNCYVQNWGGGPYANCGIVYDALGGARRAYCVVCVLMLYSALYYTCSAK